MHTPDSEHVAQSQSNDQNITSGALESAESHVARSADASDPRDGSGKEFSVAFEAFVAWGEAHDLIRPQDDFAFFLRPTDGHGDEHEAWFDEESTRWFKATYHNRFGLAWGRDGTATVGEYLTRLVLQNIYFGDDIQLVALVNSENKLRVLTSQPHIAGEPARYDEIQRWFYKLGFCRLETAGRIAWYQK